MIEVTRALGFYIDSSAGGMNWFVMFVTDDGRLSHQHVTVQGPQAALTLISAFAAEVA